VIKIYRGKVKLVIFKHPREYTFVIFKDYFKKEVDVGIVNCPCHFAKAPVLSMESKIK